MRELLKFSLLSFSLIVIHRVVSASLVESNLCSSREAYRASIGNTCPKTTYQVAVGEVKGIIYSNTELFDDILTTASSGRYLKFATSGAQVMTRLLQQYLGSLSRTLSRYGSSLQVHHAWSDQITDDTRQISLYHEGRAARISATGVTTSRLFYLAVMEGFGWVWYASSQYIIVAVEELCTRPIDLGIWLDSSGSLSRDDYQRSKDFVIDLLGRFDISQDGTHVSVGTFSNRIEYFPLDRTYDANRITTAVQRLPRFDSWTFTDLALEAWGKQIFTAQGGVRPVEQGIPRVGLLLTDGKASRAFSHRLPAIRSLGIEVFTIGIGDDIDESELNLIASIPSSEHVTILDNIGNINRFIGSLSSSTCRSAVPVEGNQGVPGSGISGQVLYYRLTCSFISRRVRIEVDSSEGYVSLYASTSSPYPGPFSLSSSDVNDTSGNVMIRSVTLPIQRGQGNVYASVGCRARQNRYRIYIFEELFEESVNATINGRAPVNTVVSALKSPYITDPSDYIIRIISGDEDGMFYLSPTSWQLTTRKLFSPNQVLFRLAVSIVSKTVSCRQSLLTVMVHVSHTQNLHPPALANPSTRISISERASIKQIVHDFRAFDADNGANGLFNMSLISGNEDGHFYISNTGILYVVKELNASRQSQYKLELEAVDFGNPRLSARHEFLVIVVDENDPPRFIELCAQRNSCECEIVEHTSKGSVLCKNTVLAYDYDVTSDFRQIFYKVTGRLSLSISTSGQLLIDGIIDRESLGYEDTIVYVSISNYQDFRTVVTSLIRIAILDINDNSPRFSTSVFSFVVEEGRRNDFFVGDVTAIDPDKDENGTVSYKTQDGIPFVVSRNGQLIANGVLDREQEPFYSFVITAFDNGVRPLSGLARVIVTLSDVNDNNPTFTSPLYIAGVPEDAPINATIITRPIIHADDDDSGVNAAVEYFIIHTYHSFPFEVDRRTGIIFVSNPQLLDAEERLHYEFKVVARDGGFPARQDTSVVNVTIINVNDEAPVFDSQQYYFSLAEDVAVGYSVGNVVAKDGDIHPQRITYLLETNERLPFVINSTSGELFTAAILNYENTSFYSFLVLAIDSGRPSPLTSSVKVFVEVLDVPHTVPVATSGTLYLSVPENVRNGTVIGQVSTRDSNDRFRLFRSPGSEKFSVGVATGQLQVQSPLDFEDQSFHHVLIQAYNFASADLYVNISVFINVTDINDNHPVISGVPSKLEVLETVGEFSVLFTTSVTDRDSARWTDTVLQLVTRTSSNCIGANFILHSNGSLVIGAGGLLDKQQCIYQLLVSAFDFGNDSRSLRTTVNCVVSIVDVNNNAPAFHNSNPLDISIREGPSIKTPITKFSASDGDSGSNAEITYSIRSCLSYNFCNLSTFQISDVGCVLVSSSHCPVKIDSNSGVVYASNAFDHEVASVYVITVVASDSGLPVQTSTTILRLNVVDVNDSPVVVSPTNSDVVLLESTLPGTTVSSFNVSDEDNFGILNTIQYNLTVIPPRYSFLLNQSGAMVSLILDSHLDFEQDSQIRVVLTAFDDRFSTQSFTNITILDVNDNKPMFSQSRYTFNISEDVNTGTVVGNVEATDLDSVSLGFLQYFIPEDLPFAIGLNDGQITTNASLDYESAARYDFEVYVQDGSGSGFFTASSNVTINIENVDDNPPMIVPPGDIIVHSPSQQDIYNLTAVDDDEPNVPPNVVFTLIKANSSSDINSSVQFLSIKCASVGSSSSSFSVITIRVMLQFSCARLFFRVHPQSGVLSLSTLCAVDFELVETVTVGSNVELSCDVKGNGLLTYYWYKDSKLLQSSRTNGLLTLQNVSYIDGGIYSCEVQNDVGRLSGTPKQLTVHGPPIIDPLENMTVATGIVAIFECVVFSTTNYTIQWTRDGNPLTNNTRVSISGSELTINGVLESHEGTYSCIASNAAGTSVSEPAKLLVCACREPFTGNFTFTIVRKTTVSSLVGVVTSPYQEYFKYHYRISSGNDREAFSINELNGTISLAKSISTSSVDRYSLQVFAIDGSKTYSGYTTVIVEVLDINSYAPEFLNLVGVIDLRELLPIGSTVVTIEARDLDEGTNGQIEVSLQETLDFALFNLSPDGSSPNTWKLTTKVVFNASEVSSSSLTLVARDLANPPSVTYRNLMLRIVDVNSPPMFIPPCVQSMNCSFDFPENTLSGSIIAEMPAYDVDLLDFGLLYYSLIGSSLFLINDQGTITLNDAVDYDSLANNVFVFNVLVTDGGGESVRAPLTVTVNDVNDIHPMFSSDLFSFDLEESLSPNSVVGTITAIDGDSGSNGMIVYSLQNTSVFSITPGTGELVLEERLDYEQQTVHIFTVIAVDQGDRPLQSSAQIKINVIDVNDVPPQLSTVNGCINVSEASPAGSLVWTATIANGVTDAVFFTIANQAEHDEFVINEQDGDLTIFKALDAEVQDFYQLRIVASIRNSGAALSDYIDLCIRVIDENDEVPYFLQGLYNFTIPRNARPGAGIGTIAAVDTDLSVRQGLVQLKYSFVGGNRNSLFLLNSTTGFISLSPAINSTRPRRYNLLQASVTDGKFHSTTQIIIETLNNDVQIPLFSTGTISVSVVENNVGSVVLAELDVISVTNYFSSSNITVSLLVHAPPEVTIVYDVPSTRLLLEGVLDKEAIPDPFLITSMISSPGSLLPPLVCNFTVTVEDVNDNYPQLNPEGPYRLNVHENASLGDRVFQLNATDVDSDSTITYSMFAYPTMCQPAFEINGLTGVITVSNATELKRIESCQFVVTVNDGGTPPLWITTTVMVTIEDVNDNSPLFSDSVMTFEISESEYVTNSVIAYISATDADRGSNSRISYSIKSQSVVASKNGNTLTNSRVSFSVHPTSGHITASTLFDYEEEDQISLVVVATDGGMPPRSSEVQVVFKILDYNDNRPVFEQQFYSIHLREDVPPMTTFLNVNATDRDGPANQQLTYSLIPSTFITVDPVTGDVYTLKQLDYEQISVISASVSVFDGNTRAKTVITIFLDNINDNRPVFESDCLTNVLESTAVGSDLLTCSAVDNDLGSYGELTFEITDGNEDGIFALTPFSGVLYLNRPLDFEKQRSFALRIASSDGEKQTITTATVNVDDVNDNPPVLVGNRAFRIAAIPENDPIQLLQLNASDADKTDLASPVDYMLTSNVSGDVLRRDFATVIRVTDLSGLSSKAIIEVNFAFSCQLVHFEIAGILRQVYLHLLTLCRVEIGVSGVLEMNGWAEFRATPIGVLPIREYCWYKDSRLLSCSPQSSLALRYLTLSDEGVYYVVTHTEADSVQSENLVFEIYVLPYLKVSSDRAVLYQQSATFTCWIINPKRVAVSHRWLFNGEELSDGDQAGNVRDGVVYYTIENVDFESQGSYTCEVTISDGGHRILQSTELSVYYGASLISLDIEVSNYSFEHYCQLFSIEVYLEEVADLYGSPATPAILEYQSEGLCEPGLCFPNPCKNYGRCFVEGNSSYCSCLPGWSGEFCETPFELCTPTNNPCQFSGICHYNRGLYGCICPPGRTGRSCELISDVCKPGSCPANQLCTPSQFSTVGFVCSPSNYFKVTINREFYRSARGYVPVGDITASTRTWNSSELDNIFILYDFEVVVRSIISDTTIIWTSGSLDKCVPRLVSANGVNCDFTLICPSQSEIPRTDQVAVCNALVQNSLFTECYTPSAPDQPISQNTSNGGIHCDFYMLDDRNVSIPADDILNILRMQPTVYVNRTEYRVLTIERSNNDSDVVGTNPLEDATENFPVWAGALFGILLSIMLIVACIVLACCIYCSKKRRKIVEKQFIVQHSGSVRVQDDPKGPYHDADFMFELSTRSSASGSFIDRQGTGEFIGEEEFYFNPAAYQKDVIYSDSALMYSNGSSYTAAKSEEFETQVIEHEDFQDVCHKKKVTVVNPISKRLQHTEKDSVRKKSENVYVSMHEGNPLYASTKELLMNTTEMIVDTEVVVEGDNGVPHLLDGSPLYASTKELLMNKSRTTETIVDTENLVVVEGDSGVPHLLDGSPNSTQDKYAAIVEVVKVEREIEGTLDIGDHCVWKQK